MNECSDIFACQTQSMNFIFFYFHFNTKYFPSFHLFSVKNVYYIRLFIIILFVCSFCFYTLFSSTKIFFYKRRVIFLSFSSSQFVSRLGIPCRKTKISCRCSGDTWCSNIYDNFSVAGRVWLLWIQYKQPKFCLFVLKRIWECLFRSSNYSYPWCFFFEVLLHPIITENIFLSIFLASRRRAENFHLTWACVCVRVCYDYERNNRSN